MKTSKILISTFVAAAAMNLPAIADDVTLTNGGTSTFQNISDTGAGNTYSYSAPGEGVADQGGWIAWGNAGHSDLALGSSSASAYLSGNGLIGITYQGGSGDRTGSEAYTVDLTCTDASNFNGKLMVLNQWNNSTLVKLSGTSWSGTEYLFAGVTRDSSMSAYTSLPYYRMYANSDRGNDTLHLTGDTTLAGITGASKGATPNARNTGDPANGFGTINNHEFITVATSGTTLTLDGAGTYAFYGTVGAADNRLSITKTGTGTQTLGGTSYLDSVSVSAGTLTLDGTVSLSSAIEVSGSGSVTVASSVVFNLVDSLKGENDIYTLVSNATLGRDFTGLGKANVLINGESLGGRQTATFATTGTVTISGAAANLVWTGDASETWDVETTRNWTNSGTSSQDSFYSGDNVTFDTADASVTLGSAISAGTMTVSENTTITVSGTNTLSASSISVAEGKTLTIEGGLGNISAEDGVSGSGTVKGSLTSEWTNTLSFGSGFSGTVNLTGGCFTINTSGIGSGAYVLEDGVNFQVTAGKDVSNAITFKGGHQFHTNGTNALTLSGKLISAVDSSITKRAGGTLYITGNTNELSGVFRVSAGTAIVGAANANGAGSLANMTSDAHGVKIFVDNGATFATHLGEKSSLATFNGDFYLESGATLRNIDGHVKYAGDIHFGVVDSTSNESNISASALASPTYSSDSTVTYTQYWQKNVEFAGVLAGAGTVVLKDPEAEAAAVYNISGSENTFSGTYKLAVSHSTDSSAHSATLILSSETAADKARINLSTTGTNLKLGAGSVKIAGLDGVSGSSVSLNSGTTSSTLEITGGGTYAGTINGAVSLTVTGAGTLTLSGANTITGNVSIEGGVLDVSADGARLFNAGSNVWLDDNAVTVKSGAELKVASLAYGGSLGNLSHYTARRVLDGGKITVTTTSYAQGITVNTTGGTLEAAAGADVTFIGDSDTSAQPTLNLSGTLRIGGEGNIIVRSGGNQNSVTGSGSLLKFGSGTLTLSNANSFTGGTEIETGTLAAGNASALGTGSVTIDGGHLSVADGVELSLSSITVVLGGEYDQSNANSSAAIIGTGTLASGTKITLTKSAEEAAAALAAETATETFRYKIFEENSTLATSANESWFTLGEGWNDGGWNYSYDNGILTLSMIPEPSAFGLLAGLGALALVAARRRRKS